MPRSTPDKATARRTPITTELLVDAAIELIESDGLDMLSMRRLADRFGIQAASVYWYVASKEHMLDLVVDRLHDMAVQTVLVEHVEQRRTEDETRIRCCAGSRSATGPSCSRTRTRPE